VVLLLIDAVLQLLLLVLFAWGDHETTLLVTRQPGASQLVVLVMLAVVHEPGDACGCCRLPVPGGHL
jgi:hypothetical protein